MFARWATKVICCHSIRLTARQRKLYLPENAAMIDAVRQQIGIGLMADRKRDLLH